MFECGRSRVLLLAGGFVWNIALRWCVRLELTLSFQIPDIMSVPWTRLIRFVATDGRTLRGELIMPSTRI